MDIRHHFFFSLSIVIAANFLEISVSQLQTGVCFALRENGRVFVGFSHPILRSIFLAGPGDSTVRISEKMQFQDADGKQAKR